MPAACARRDAGRRRGRTDAPPSTGRATSRTSTTSRPGCWARRASCGRREVSRGAEVSLLSARKFWHALGFPIVDDEDALFTEADLTGAAVVAGMVREGVLDEATALSMTRAFAGPPTGWRCWQTQLMAEALGDAPESTPAARRGRLPPTGHQPRRAGPRRPAAHGWPSWPTGSSRCSSTRGAGT